MKVIKKFIVSTLLAITISLVTGCTASYKHDFLRPPNTMKPQAKVLIVTPKNGYYNETLYETSGTDVVEALTRELQSYSNSIDIIPNTNINDIIEDILHNYNYIFIPEILHWEDRLTGWSMRPDRIEIRVDIYNGNREILNSIDVKSKSANIVWVSQAPKSLLPKSFRITLQELFQ